MAELTGREGLRWRLSIGRYDGVERFAVDELQREVQSYLPYVLPVCRGSAGGDGHEIVAGTLASNPRVAQLVEQLGMAVPAEPQGYAIKVTAAPAGGDRRLIVIAGRDECGLSYAVQDFNARVLELRVFPEEIPGQRRKALDELPDFDTSQRPAIQERGLWTWGYVLYDYKRYLDNMARLRMNQITIWNDCPPVNIDAIVEHAHSRGIRIILGFHWGYGQTDMELGRSEDRQRLKRMILEDYDRNYRGLNIDGIYFQTLTETHDDLTAGMPIAAAARLLVNDVAGTLLESQPELLIQFGVHTSSVVKHLDELVDVDPRVQIVWEDAGTIPYHNLPTTELTDKWGKVFRGYLGQRGKSDFDCTVELSQKLATLRPNGQFSMCAKGWTSLRWLFGEFEHHGEFILGCRDQKFIRRRLSERQGLWDQVNTMWLRNYPYAAKFYRAILEKNPSPFGVVGLVDDGLFEAAIQPSVAILGHTLWDPYQSDSDILWLSNSPYYRKFDM